MAVQLNRFTLYTYYIVTIQGSNGHTDEKQRKIISYLVKTYDFVENPHRHMVNQMGMNDTMIHIQKQK